MMKPIFLFLFFAVSRITYGQIGSDNIITYSLPAFTFFDGKGLQAKQKFALLDRSWSYERSISGHWVAKIAFAGFEKWYPFEDTYPYLSRRLHYSHTVLAGYRFKLFNRLITTTSVGFGRQIDEVSTALYREASCYECFNGLLDTRQGWFGIPFEASFSYRLNQYLLLSASATQQFSLRKYHHYAYGDDTSQYTYKRENSAFILKLGLGFSFDDKAIKDATLHLKRKKNPNTSTGN